VSGGAIRRNHQNRKVRQAKLADGAAMCAAEIPSGQGPVGVKSGKAQKEQMLSALPLKADMRQLTRNVRKASRPDSCTAVNGMVRGTTAPHKASAARRRLRRKLLPRFETALRASARLLHDLVRVDRAPQLGDAFDARARGSF
jgi:hypothetical protein